MISNLPIGGEMEIYLKDFTPSESESVWPNFAGYEQIRCDTGRTALKLALHDWQQRTNGFGRIWVPAYLCPSVLKVIRSQGILFEEYIDLPGTQAVFFPPKPENDDMVLVVHYFGKLNSPILGWVADNPERRWRILEDCVQSPYTEGVGLTGEYAITSLRKWWPAPDGATLYTIEPLLSEPALASPDEIFINQRLIAKIIRRTVNEEQYYLELIKLSEMKLDTSQPRRCSFISEYLLSRIDKAVALKHRLSNWHYIHSRLYDVIEKSSMVSALYDGLLVGEVPLTYPILVGNGKRDKLRSWLADQQIYCPIHWRLESSAEEASKCLSEKMMSLPIDQRYNKEDMDRIIAALATYRY